MDNRAEVREFLTSRRDRITPEQVGLPAGGPRKVVGLRRSEVATLAGMSVEYYTKLERGHISGASPEVLHSLAQALMFDEAERAHLSIWPTRQALLADHGNGAALRLDTETRSAVDAQRIHCRACICQERPYGSACRQPAGPSFHTELYDMPGQSPNIVRHVFSMSAFNFYPDWDGFADITVAILRTEAAREPYNKELHDLIGELCTRSDEFRTRWGRHDVRHHGSGFKSFHHPVVGEMTLAYEGMDMEADHGLTFTVYTAEPGSKSEEAMLLLASWAASEYETEDETYRWNAWKR